MKPPPLDPDKLTKEQIFEYLLRAISTDIVMWLMRDNGLSLQEALSTWYNSTTFEKVSDPLTGMYIESSGYNYDWLKRELVTGRFQP